MIDGGSPARRRRRGATATGERRETASNRASVASDRGDWDGGASEASGRGIGGMESGGRGWRARGVLSGCTARCPDSALRRARDVWQPRGNSALPRGPSAAHGG
jgi:hypothetical protein